MSVKGTVFKYNDNVDTDVIIPARHLTSADPKHLAAHCMEDIDTSFATSVKVGDIITVKILEIDDKRKRVSLSMKDI